MSISGGRRVRQAAVAVALGATIAALPACGSALTYPENALTIYAPEPVSDLLPANVNAEGGSDVLDAVFTYLVDYESKSGALRNAAAQSIQTPDQKVWTVKLKSGWKFQDGTPMTSESFVKAWNWAAYGPNGAANREWFDEIVGYDDLTAVELADGTKGTPKSNAMTGLKVLDQLTFRISLKTRVSSFAYKLGYRAFAPLPEVFYSDPKAFGQHPIGNGPFKFVRWDRRRAIILTKFADYSGVKPSVNDVMFKYYQSPDSAYADLLAGNLDILPKVPTSVLLTRQAAADLDGRVIEQPYGAIRSMAFPLYDKRFQNPLLRRAISMAINRKEIVTKVLAGSVLPADTFVPPVVNGYVPASCGVNCVFDPEGARALLDQAGGYDGTLSFAYNSDGGHKPSVDAVCQSIRRVLGIDCVPKSFVDFKTYITAYGNKEMSGPYTSGWAMDYPLNENFLLPTFASKGAANYTGYSNPQFDSLLALGKQQPLEQSIKTYQQAEKLLAQDMPALPLWYSEVNAGYSAAVSDVVFNSFGKVDLNLIKKTA